jgi:hypothetical protein
VTQNGVVAGTPEYMAPEQARGETVDHRADLFSLGSVLYALCTGAPPFRGSTTLAVLRKLCDQKERPLRDVNPEMPAWLEALVARLLAKNPNERFPSAAEVAALLEGYLAHLQQPATTPAPALPPAPRRRRLFWLAAPALLVALGLGFGLHFLGGGGGDAPAKATPGELKARFHPDLRNPDVTLPLLRPLGEGVHWEAGGVRLTVPAGKGDSRAGIMMKLTVHGDFDMVLTYEILKVDKPSSGYGVGVSLYAAVEPNSNDAVSLARRLLPDGTTAFVSDRLKPSDGKLTHKVKQTPSTASAGKLRLQRTGSKVRFLVAEGDQREFTLVDELDFDDADLQFIQIGGNSGWSESSLELRLLDFTLAAEDLPGLAEATATAPGAAGPPGGGKGWLATAELIGLGVTLAAAVSLGAWLYLRRSRREPAPEREENAAADAASLVFPCSGCGKKLKVRSDLAGKKVKCPHCGCVERAPADAARASEGVVLSPDGAPRTQ